MKMKVTRRGVYDAKGEEIKVGTVLKIDGDKVPGYLVNKAEQLDGAVGIVNPAEPKTYDEMTRAELDKLAEDRQVDIKEAKNKGDVIAALQLADEAAKTA